jgi:hypothetical protein
MGSVGCVDSATQTASSIALSSTTTGLAITGDGRYVYATSKSGLLIQINTATETASIVATGLGEAVSAAIP